MKTAAYLINYAFQEHSDNIVFKTQLILIFLTQFMTKKVDDALFHSPFAVILIVKYQRILNLVVF